MNNPQRLPCGCVMGTETLPDGNEAFVFAPHSLDCEYYLYTIKAAEEQSKPMRKLDFTGESVELSGQTCPMCQAELVMARDMSGEGATPSPGDMTLCSQCAGILVFGEDLELLAPTDEQMAAAPPELNYVQRRMLEAKQS